MTCAAHHALAVLGKLDPTVWRITPRRVAPVAVRTWPDRALDTVVVIGPRRAVAYRQVTTMPKPSLVWSTSGEVEQVIRAIQALDPPTTEVMSTPTSPAGPTRSAVQPVFRVGSVGSTTSEGGLR